ncbi:heptosyltransferase [Synergistales bacterium]|nr:heptosyltransferase [Synergistales bacterium]
MYNYHIMTVIPQQGDKVLWIRFSAFGDVLQAAAASRRFKLKYPGARLTFLTKPAYADIISKQPYIDDVITWDVSKNPSGFFKTAAKIRASGFKYLFSMHRGFAAALTAVTSGTPLRFGYNSSAQFFYKTTHWEYLDNLGVDFKDRSEPSIFADAGDTEWARRKLLSLPAKKLFVIIGASQSQKLWPAGHWTDFLRPLISENWGVVLNGFGSSEARIAREIKSALGDSLVLDMTELNATFAQTAAIAKECAASIGNDTGPLHLAALTGTPTLGLFGVTDAWSMNLRMPNFREVRVSCPKAGCWNYRCPIECLADISPQRALAAFRNMETEVIKLPL